MVAPVWFPVPPRGYGGIELVVALLADGLAARGHDVTLFASGGSQSAARVVSPLAEAPDPALLGNPWYDAFHAFTAYLYDLDTTFDVVHDHAGIVGPVLGALVSKLTGQPVVHTLHGPWTPEVKLLYRSLARHIQLVAISEAQMAASGGIPHAATVYNGIDLAQYPLRTDKEQRLVYIGRANPDKGPAEAIQVARRAGLPITLILKRSEPPEQAYFAAAIEPLLGDDIEVLEGVSHALKIHELGRASALVFPIRWSEPFGLVMAEAMACGTPVVTTNWGAAPEVVADGLTGFRRDTTEDLAEALRHIGDLDPSACRARVQERFSAEAMVAGYEAVYARAARL